MNPERVPAAANVFPLQRGEVHLWQCRLDREDVEEFRRHLSSDEIERMERFKMPHLRRRYAIARGALRILAGRYLGTAPGELAFRYGEHGKPEIEGVHFNLSHSGDLMAAAFSLDGPLGLDIEEISPRLHARDIAGRYFSSREREELETPDDERFLRGFFRLWTSKEALMKATSLGFALELSKIEIGLNPLRVVSLDWNGSQKWDLYAVDPAEGFMGTLAAPPDRRIERFVFGESQIGKF